MLTTFQNGEGNPKVTKISSLSDLSNFERNVFLNFRVPKICDGEDSSASFERFFKFRFVTEIGFHNFNTLFCPFLGFVRVWFSCDATNMPFPRLQQCICNWTPLSSSNSSNNNNRFVGHVSVESRKDVLWIVGLWGVVMTNKLKKICFVNSTSFDF